MPNIGDDARLGSLYSCAMMQEQRGSVTAEVAAQLRAVHQVLDGRPPILEDPIAQGLVLRSSEGEIVSNAENLQSPFLRLLRSSFVARSRATEDALRMAVEQGARQFVMLGAGYETFAFRQPEWAAGLRIFEFDHPATQAAKRSALESHEIPHPPNVVFHPVDLEIESFASALAASTFDASEASFFSCLGMIPYLSLSTIHATLSAILEPSHKTWISLSFVLPDGMLDDGDAEVVRISSAAAGARGEPWISRFHPDEMERVLRELGCGEVHHIGPDEMARRYFSDRMDQLPVARFEQLMLASKSAR